MKLSIITINYNNVDGLRKTIQSVIEQEFTDFEWIVIDGGSTDGSKELLETYQDKFSYWVSEPDNGIYHAMNKGTAKAKGEYCQYLNSGDYYIHGHVLADVFRNPLPGDVNYGDVWCVKNDKVVEKRTYPDTMTLSFLFKSPLGHQAVFIKTEAALEHPYKEQYTISGDRGFFLELYCNNYAYKHLKYPIVYFDTEGIGSTNRTLQKRRKQFYDVKREFFCNQVVEDIERLLAIEEEFAFVRRIPPLNCLYRFFKKLQSLKSRL